MVCKLGKLRDINSSEKDDVYILKYKQSIIVLQNKTNGRNRVSQETGHDRK